MGLLRMLRGGLLQKAYLTGDVLMEQILDIYIYVYRMVLICGSVDY